MKAKHKKILEISQLLKTCPKTRAIIPKNISQKAFVNTLFLMPEEQLDQLHAALILEDSLR